MDWNDRRHMPHWTRTCEPRWRTTTQLNFLPVKQLEQGPARHLPSILDGGAVSMSPLRAWKVQVSGRPKPDLFRRSDRFPVGR